MSRGARRRSAHVVGGRGVDHLVFSLRARIKGSDPLISPKSRVWRGGREAEGNGLLNRHTGLNLYRGFESLPLRSGSIIAMDPFLSNPSSLSQYRVRYVLRSTPPL